MGVRFSVNHYFRYQAVLSSHVFIFVSVAVLRHAVLNFNFYNAVYPIAESPVAVAPELFPD